MSGRAKGNGKGQLKTQLLCFPFIGPAHRALYEQLPLILTWTQMAWAVCVCVCARVFTHRCAEVLHLDTPPKWLLRRVGRLSCPAPTPGFQLSATPGIRLPPVSLMDVLCHLCQGGPLSGLLVIVDTRWFCLPELWPPPREVLFDVRKCYLM